jgi:hypothetical protein
LSIFSSSAFFLCLSSSACLYLPLPIWHSTESTTSSTAFAQFDSRITMTPTSFSIWRYYLWKQR